MPGWSEILSVVDSAQNPLERLASLRLEYLKEIHRQTGRNVVAYYSGWLKKPDAPHVEIDEQDKNAFMSVIHGMDRTKGLDLLLHTPGGDLAAMESIVDYLHVMFKGDIRAFIPQISMSAGSMIALSCKEIIMGKQSSMGPIDPQKGGIACQSVIEEFDKAVGMIEKHPAALGLWQMIFAKYNPTFLSECENAIKWSESLAHRYLAKAGYSESEIDKILNVFLNHKETFSHNRHLSIKDCVDAGLENVRRLEDDQELQEAVLSLHHCYMIMFDKFVFSKIVENQNGKLFIQTYNAPKAQTVPQKR